MTQQFDVLKRLALVLGFAGSIGWGLMPLAAQAEDQQPAGVEEASPEAELADWNGLKGSGAPEDYLAYLQKYPNGMFYDPAKARYEELAGVAYVPVEEDPIVVEETPEEPEVVEPPVKKRVKRVAAPPPEIDIVAPPVRKRIKQSQDAPKYDRIKKSKQAAQRRNSIRISSDEPKQWVVKKPRKFLRLKSAGSVKKRIAISVQRAERRSRIVRASKDFEPVVVRKKPRRAVVRQPGCYTSDGRPVSCKLVAVKKVKRSPFIGDGGSNGGGGNGGGGNNGGGGGGGGWGG